MQALAGIISPTAPPRLPYSPRCMVDRLCHSASQTTGYTTFGQLGLFAGWVSRRNSPLAPNAPAWSTSGRVALHFAGEDFTHGSATTTALSHIASLYGRDGHAALRTLNGWFHGLIIDLRDDTVTLFNDRYGLGRVYFHSAPDRGFFFSSQAKSILAILPHLR